MNLFEGKPLSYPGMSKQRDRKVLWMWMITRTTACTVTTMRRPWWRCRILMTTMRLSSKSPFDFNKLLISCFKKPRCYSLEHKHMSSCQSLCFLTVTSLPSHHSCLRPMTRWFLPRRSNQKPLRVWWRVRHRTLPGHCQGHRDARDTGMPGTLASLDAGCQDTGEII